MGNHRVSWVSLESFGRHCVSWLYIGQLGHYTVCLATRVSVGSLYSLFGNYRVSWVI